MAQRIAAHIGQKHPVLHCFCRDDDGIALYGATEIRNLRNHLLRCILDDDHSHVISAEQKEACDDNETMKAELVEIYVAKLAVKKPMVVHTHMKSIRVFWDDLLMYRNVGQFEPRLDLYESINASAGIIAGKAKKKSNGAAANNNKNNNLKTDSNNNNNIQTAVNDDDSSSSSSYSSDDFDYDDDEDATLDPNDPIFDQLADDELWGIGNNNNNNNNKKNNNNHDDEYDELSEKELRKHLARSNYPAAFHLNKPKSVLDKLMTFGPFIPARSTVRDQISDDSSDDSSYGSDEDDADKSYRRRFSQEEWESFLQSPDQKIRAAAGRFSKNFKKRNEIYHRRATVSRGDWTRDNLHKSEEQDLLRMNMEEDLENIIMHRVYQDKAEADRLREEDEKLEEEEKQKNTKTPQEVAQESRRFQKRIFQVDIKKNKLIAALKMNTTKEFTNNNTIISQQQRQNAAVSSDDASTAPNNNNNNMPMNTIEDAASSTNNNNKKKYYDIPIVIKHKELFPLVKNPPSRHLLLHGDATEFTYVAEAMRYQYTQQLYGNFPHILSFKIDCDITTSDENAFQQQLNNLTLSEEEIKKYSSAITPATENNSNNNNNKKEKIGLVQLLKEKYSLTMSTPPRRDSSLSTLLKHRGNIYDISSSPYQHAPKESLLHQVIYSACFVPGDAHNLDKDLDTKYPEFLTSHPKYFETCKSLHPRLCRYCGISGRTPLWGLRFLTCVSDQERFRRTNELARTNGEGANVFLEHEEAARKVQHRPKATHIRWLAENKLYLDRFNFPFFFRGPVNQVFNQIFRPVHIPTRTRVVLTSRMIYDPATNSTVPQYYYKTNTAPLYMRSRFDDIPVPSNYEELYTPRDRNLWCFAMKLCRYAYPGDVVNFVSKFPFAHLPVEKGGLGADSVDETMMILSSHMSPLFVKFAPELRFRIISGMDGIDCLRPLLKFNTVAINFILCLASVWTRDQFAYHTPTWTDKNYQEVVDYYYSHSHIHIHREWKVRCDLKGQDSPTMVHLMKNPQEMIRHFKIDSLKSFYGRHRRLDFGSLGIAPVRNPNPEYTRQHCVKVPHPQVWIDRNKNNNNMNDDDQQQQQDSAATNTSSSPTTTFVSPVYTAPITTVSKYLPTSLVGKGIYPCVDDEELIKWRKLFEKKAYLMNFNQEAIQNHKHTIEKQFKNKPTGPIPIPYGVKYPLVAGGGTGDIASSSSSFSPSPSPSPSRNTSHNNNNNKRENDDDVDDDEDDEDEELRRVNEQDQSEIDLQKQDGDYDRIDYKDIPTYDELIMIRYTVRENTHPEQKYWSPFSRFYHDHVDCSPFMAWASAFCAETSFIGYHRRRNSCFIKAVIYEFMSNIPAEILVRFYRILKVHAGQRVDLTKFPDLYNKVRILPTGNEVFDKDEDAAYSLNRVISAWIPETNPEFMKRKQEEKDRKKNNNNNNNNNTTTTNNNNENDDDQQQQQQQQNQNKKEYNNRFPLKVVPFTWPDSDELERPINWKGHSLRVFYHVMKKNTDAEMAALITEEFVEEYFTKLSRGTLFKLFPTEEEEKAEKEKNKNNNNNDDDANKKKRQKKPETEEQKESFYHFSPNRSFNFQPGKNPHFNENGSRKNVYHSIFSDFVQNPSHFGIVDDVCYQEGVLKHVPEHTKRKEDTTITTTTASSIITNNNNNIISSNDVKTAEMQQEKDFSSSANHHNHENHQINNNDLSGGMMSADATTINSSITANDPLTCTTDGQIKNHQVQLSLKNNNNATKKDVEVQQD
jgi:hypothetical protein